MALALERERKLRVATEVAHVLDGIERNARRLESDTPVLSGVRVLVVDDDPSAREAMAKVLGIAGAETRTAASTADALEGMGAWRPDR